MHKYKKNKAIKKAVAFFIAFVMVFGSAPLEALSQFNIHFPGLNTFTETAFASYEGSAGTSAMWSIDDNGVLTLSGTDKVTNIGWDSIRSAITSVIIETGITSIPVNAFSDCVNLESVSIASTVTNLGAYAFARCSALESVTIPGSVIGMGSYVFSDCGLKNVTVSDGATVLGDYIFQNCTSLTQAVIPDSVTSKGTYAFKGCTALKKVTLSGGWTTVPTGICYGCSSLESVVIPDSCTAIGNNAFYNCNSLSDVYLYGGAESWSNVDKGSGNSCLSDAIEHYYIEIAEQPATCTEDGLSAYSYWSATIPVEYINEPEIIESLGHNSGNAVIENSVSSTCANTGSYDSVVYCLTCGVELSRDTITVPATGNHTGGEPVIENEVSATCAVAGRYDTVVYCTVCSGEISRETIIVPATGNHIYSSAVVENDIPANCTNDRMYDSVVYCSDCGNELTRETVTDIGSALGHSFTNYISDDNATLIQDGTKTAICDRCNVTDTVQDVNSATLTYVIENDSVKITLCKTTFSGALEIPAQINGYNVTEIDSSAFRDCLGLTSVIIPDGIVSVGEEAFCGCYALRLIAVPSSVMHIGTDAFDDCGDAVISCQNGSFAHEYCVENDLLCVRDIDRSHYYGDVDFVHFGAPLHYDETFSYSLNDVAVYNNNHNGAVTINKITKTADCPTKSAYMLEIETNGEAKPSLGGFVQLFSPFSGGEVYYHVFMAKIPVGYKVNAASNSLGYQYEREFLTSQEGTGKWELYVYKTTYGLVFPGVPYNKDGGYVYLSCEDGSNSSSVKWYVGYTNIFSYEHKGFSSDVMFTSGTANVYYYNNNASASNNVSVSRVTATADCPNTSGYMLQIQTTPGTSKPGLGGFYQTVTPEAGKTYYHRIHAKLPEGFRLEYKANAISAQFNWITSNEGTGVWQTYCYKVTVDKNPTDLGTFGFLALYPDEMESEWVTDPYTSTSTTTWYLGYSNIVGGYEFSENLNKSDLIVTKRESLNGHIYCLYNYDLRWNLSKALCEKMGGHLATVTTSTEESTIASLCTGGTMAGYRLGAIDMETEGTWKWITGETWSYTAWGSSQPDNSTVNDSSGENYLEFYMSTSAWNDVHNAAGSRGFICEFEANYVPVKSVVYNNHLYSLYNESLSWSDAETKCVQAGGHLASITSSEEQNVITDLVSDQFNGLYWIGAHDTGTNSNWTWSSGEPFEYTNWGPGEPSTADEKCAHVYSRPYSTKVTGDWNDCYDTGSPDTEYYKISNFGYICEIDLDQYTAYKGNTYNNNYYEVCSQNAFWTDAKEYAESRGGHLATIADENEDAAIASLLSEETRRGCWIGGSDFDTEGTWKWVDETPVEYTNWASGEPNNTEFREHFMEYCISANNQWNDLRNNRIEIGFVVEYENAIGTYDDISWSYDGTTLTISGSGDLTDIDDIINTLWFEHIRDVRFDGNFDVVITPFKNTEWYKNHVSGPVVVDGYLLDYKGDMPTNTELNLDEITVVCSDALKNQVNLKSIMLGESLEKVCINAFSRCTGLETVELSDNVIEIADNSFNGCSSLTVIGFYNEYVETYATDKSFAYNPYTVTLTLNPTDGEILNNTISVIAKKALGNTIIPEAEDDEYAFNGWFTDEGCMTPVTSETVFNEDATIYAGWLEVSSVVIKTMPDTLQYVIGDSIDTTGLVLTATYPNGETRDFDSGFICTPSRFTKQGKYRMKVDFKGKFVYFYVEVKATENMTLSVASLPNKLNYETGEEFDSTGLTLLLDYGNGITKTIKKDFVCDYDFSTAGTKTVTVSYTAGETTLSTGVNVEVTEADYVVYSDDIVCNGDTFEVPVKIKGNQGLMEISLNFSYDSELINPISITGNDEMDGMLFDSIIENDGTFNVYWSGNEAFYDNGTMFTLTFESLVNRKCDTEIGISYDATETCNEDWLDISLNCRPIGVGIIVPEAPLFYSESIDVSAGNTVDIPIYVSNPLNLTQAVFFITYDKNAFMLESVNSAYGTTSVSNGNKLQVVWRGNIEEDGVLFTVRLSSEASAIGQYVFEMSCENAVFEDTGMVKCRDFTVNVQNQNAARVYLEGDTLVPGEDIDVNIMIDNNPEIMGFSLTITYDSDILTLKALKKCTLTNSGAFDYVDNNGIVKIVWNATDDITGNGALFRATFSAAAGSYSSTDLSLSYDPRDTFDSDWNTVVFDCEGTTLREYIPQEYAVYWHINDKEYRTMQLEGAEIWIPNVIPAHYTVVGWNPEIPATMPPQEMHFTALLSPTLYTATFYIDGVAVCSQEYTIETEKLNEPEIPPKPYCFAKWQGYNLKTGGDLEIHAVYDPPRIIAPAQKTLHIDETYRIITSGNFDTTRYVWRSDNTTVATVDKHGNVTAVGIGTATIKVTRYGKDAFGNEVSAYTTINIKVTKEKVKYNSFSEWLKAFVERFFDEIIYDILENLKRIGFILAFRVN